MVDPLMTYAIDRTEVRVERVDWGREPWLVCASRRQSKRFVGTSVVAWCATREDAQNLAKLICAVEVTRQGAVIWPDGRTEPAPKGGLQCDNCAWTSDDEGAAEVTDTAHVYECLLVGGVGPHPMGDCPDCGCFVYRNEDIVTWERLSKGDEPPLQPDELGD